MAQHSGSPSLHSSIRDNNHDALTGLLTHHAFRSLVDRRLSSGMLKPTDNYVNAIVYFNIENFKHYNQRFGFTAGDELIKHVAFSILRAFPGRVAGRYSADQFVVLAHVDEVEDGARQVRAAFRSEHKDSSIWLRAGWYAIGDDDYDAGLACDRAKLACDDLRGRRDQYLREYDEDLQRHIVWRRYVLDHFDEAIEKHYIQAWCQPIIRVATGETCDVEALARWIDPVEGIVPPMEFVPVLEEARVIDRMDMAILRDICETCKSLHDQGKPYIPASINLSRLDFELREDIVGDVIAILDEYDIPHNMLSVEVTESALAGNQQFLKREIDRFREAGVEVWMDDFGSGYSSLNVLEDYNFDLVKIDMAFIRAIEKTEQARIMVAKVIDMAKELGLKTLVEGVETQEQYEFLRTLGCGRVQGWLFGKASSKPDSIEGVGNDVHPEVELLAKRDFYEEVGRVNLMRPDPKWGPDGSYLPSDQAACIIRRRNGVYEYLNTNELFEEYLHSIGIGSVEEDQRLINDPTSDHGKFFLSQIARCEASGTWERYAIPQEGRVLIVRMRPISSLEEFNALAVLMVIDEVIDAW